MLGDVLHIVESTIDHVRIRSATSMLSTIAHLYRDVWGPRMESIFRNALMASVYMPDATLLTAFQLLGFRLASDLEEK